MAEPGPSPANKPRRLGSIWENRAVVTWVCEVFLLPLSAIVFIHSPWVGFGLWFLLVPTPYLAISALASLMFIEGVARALKRMASMNFPLEARTNGLLSGLVGSWILAPARLAVAETVFLVAVVVLITLFLALLFSRLQVKNSVPVMVWPYCLVASALFILLPAAAPASAAFFGWSESPIPNDVNGLLSAFSRSMGVFVYSPWAMFGLLVAALILACSPSMFLAGVSGWLAGVLFSMGIIHAGAPLNGIPGLYNSFIAGIAMGSVFLRPGLSGLAFASLAGAFSALCAGVIQIQTDYSGLSYLPLPFLLTTTLGVLARSYLGVAGWYTSDNLQGITPEQRRVSSDWLEARWGDAGVPRSVLPVKGAVEIAQGVAGTLTHRGPWRYALDLQRPCLAPGTEAEFRPSIWASEVFSPIVGEVVSIERSVPDNPLGAFNLGENWGNYVLVRGQDGSCASVCHLMQHSVPVGLGDLVDYSTLIGTVGNSGRSSVPHLHFQMQDSPKIGDETRRFILVNYCDVDAESGVPVHWNAAGMATEKTVVAAAITNPELHRLLTGIVPGTGIWVSGFEGASDRGSPTLQAGPSIVQSVITDAGHLKISTRNKEHLLAEFDSDGLRVIRVDSSPGSFIETLAIPLSTIPYAATHGLTWEDALYLPLTRSLRSPREMAAPFIGSCISRVKLRCEETWLTGEKFFVIEAKSRLACRSAETIVHLYLSAARGLVRLTREQANCKVTYDLASFELNEI